MGYCKIADTGFSFILIVHTLSVKVLEERKTDIYDEFFIYFEVSF